MDSPCLPGGKPLSGLGLGQERNLAGKTVEYRRLPIRGNPRKGDEEMAEQVESVTQREQRAESAATAGREGVEPLEPLKVHRGVKAAVLSFFFPGCGHLYAGRPVRGVFWSAFFAGVLMPTALFSYVVLASFDRGALGRICLIVFIFLALCATGAFLASSGSTKRRPPGASPRAPSRPPHVGILGGHAAALTFLVAFETMWFLQTFLGTRAVETGAFEPLLARGQVVTVAYSRYVRPVHGDFVLFTSGKEGGRELLGRVLAKPRDSIELKGGRLYVNGLEVDLRRDQRKDLEKAGRRERRWRILPGQSPSPASAEDSRELTLNGDAWGPFLVPEKRLLAIPDDVSVTGGVPRAVLIPESSLLGRAIGS